MWAESVASFGGMYYTEDGEKLVVLFTDDPELYRGVVAQLASAPERLILRRTTRSQAEIDRTSDVLQRRFMADDAAYLNVSTAGFCLFGNEWIFKVGIDPYSEESAEKIRDLAAPERVVVAYEERHTEYR
jgi:hypothetical protein